MVAASGFLQGYTIFFFKKMASYMTPVEIESAMKKISRDIERLQASAHRGKAGRNKHHRPSDYDIGATFLSTPVGGGHSTPDSTHRDRALPNTIVGGTRSKRQQPQLDSLLSDVKSQWQMECERSTDNSLKYRETPSFLPVVDGADGTRCMDLKTGKRGKTTRSGTPVVRVIRHPVTGKHHSAIASRIKAREFDGSSCFEDYITHFERVARVNAWTEADQADFLLIALKGPALEVACSLSTHQQSSYRDIVKALEHRFGLEKQRIRHRAELTSRKRRVGESVAELGQAIRKLVRRAYPKNGLEFQEDFAVEQFKNALGDLELKRALFQGKPTTLDEAVEIVSEAEAWLKAEKVGHSRKVQDQDNDADKPEASKGTNETERLLREVLAALSRRPDGRFKDWKPGCWNCGSMDHFRAACPEGKGNTTQLN